MKINNKLLVMLFSLAVITQSAKASDASNPSRTKLIFNASADRRAELAGDADKMGRLFRVTGMALEAVDTANGNTALADRLRAMHGDATDKVVLDSAFAASAACGDHWASKDGKVVAEWTPSHRLFGGVRGTVTVGDSLEDAGRHLAGLGKNGTFWAAAIGLGVEGLRRYGARS